MAFSNENGSGSDMVMPVTPMGGNYGGGFGNGGFGGDWGWIILLLLFAGGGWGNGYGGGFGGGYDFPWLFNGQQNINTNTNNGFRDAMINDNITSVRDGIHGLSTQICGGFSDTQMAMANGFASVEQGANARQMADMQQMFGLQSALQNCCCENRAATQDLKYTIATEESATRQANTANTQAILDKLCQLELDGVKAQVEAKNDRIAELQTQLNMATLRESQTAQNAFIAQGLNNEVDALYNRLNNCPVPTTPVYGRTPIFTCNNNGCGCGNGSF
ncbi:hypothetical protein [Ruminococcus sp.]|uniref:hypothetical protein n=1 Tax=Ruminococcus sp. TaxID=41978 RepID=UPI00388FFA81